MSTIQSTLSPIDTAAKMQDRVFILYVVVLVVGGLLTAGLTVWLWKATTRYQNAVKSDADARITEAKRDIRNLESDNLKLSGDLETEKAKVAGLQKDASDAKSVQQRVEIELAKQQERAAVAERALLELQEHNKPRRLTVAQQQQIAAKLRRFAGKRTNLFVYVGENETGNLASDIIAALKEAGWVVSVLHGSEMGRVVSGILVEIKPNGDMRDQPAAAALVSALAAERLLIIGPQVSSVEWIMATGNTDANASITITIGNKP